MKSYTQNKETDIQWIEEIPQHWDLWKVKFVSFYQNGSSFKSDLFRNDGDVYIIRIGDLVDSKVTVENATTITKADSEGFENVLLKKNDILLALTGATIGKSASFELEEECYLNQRVALFRPRKQISKEYLMLFIDSNLFRIHIDFECYGGAQENVGKSQILNAKIPLPSLDEQNQIASYLNHNTKRIDRFIANRNKQIELFEEQKEAIINKTLTKGIDHSVKLKYSGIDWIGDIPVDWSQKRLRFVGQCQNGISIDGDSFGHGHPFISYGDVYKNSAIPKIPSGLVNSTLKDRQQFSVMKGDILFTRTSETLDELGIASTSLHNAKDAVFAGFLIRMRPFKNCLEPNYSKYYFRSKLLREYFNNQNDLVTRASLNQDTLKNLPVILPPIKIQIRIAAYLDIELEERNQLINKYQHQIAFMQEYRNSLINKAVTGKIDVREWQPKNKQEIRV